MNKKLLFGLLIGFFTIPGSLQAESTIQVGIGPGYSYNTIQDGINAAQNGDVVWVHPGTYTGPGNRDITFLGKSITVDGKGAAIVDCQQQGRGFIFDSGEGLDSILSGLSITNGYSTDGGGIYTSSSPTIKHCIFTGNTGTNYGGGIKIVNGDPEIINCLFTQNESNRGAGIFSHQSDVKILNSTVSGNQANVTGGGIYLYQDNPIVRDSIIWGNTNGEIEGSPPSVTYCDIKDGYPGIGNIDLDPLLTSGPLGDFYLSQIPAGQLFNSPCLDTGSDLASVFGLDIFTTRIDHIGDAGNVDMGFHYTPEPSTFVILSLGTIGIIRRRRH